MLVSFSLENSDSFINEVELKMEATSIKAHSYSLITQGTRKLLPVISIYGANSSGKTNLLSSMLGFFGRITGNYTYYFEGFIFDKKADNITKLKLSCILDEVEYQLAVHVDNDPFNDYLYESFSFRKSKDKKFDLIYERIWKNNWEINYGASSFAKSLAEEIKYVHVMEKSSDRLLVTSLGRRDMNNCFGLFYNWVNKSLGLSTANEDNKIFSFSDIEINKNFFSDNDKKKALNDFISMINPMIKDVDITEDKLQHTDKYVLKYKKDTWLKNGYRIESMGTKKVIQLYPSIYQILKDGGLFVIDEIENSLHPLLVAKIIGLFTDPDVNTGRGQLIFTSHNPLIMDKKYLRADEIMFVDKDEGGVSTLTSLADYNVRSDLDFCKNYIIGSFGGVPLFDSVEEAAD